MILETLSIDSVQQLLDHLDSLDIDRTYWFRGQRSSSWPLLPGYYRYERAPSETTLLNRFRQNASRLVEAPVRNDFDWMFIMQHYGAPTRLLDWSENPLTALYFSVFSSAEDNLDGALWVLDPVLLNKNSHIADPEEENYIPSFDDDEIINPYTLKSVRTFTRAPLFPVATIATRSSARIQAQAGVFTMHHIKKIPVEQVGDSLHVSKVVVPATSKPRIRQQLSSLGFTRFHLFPELESVGHSIREGLS